MSGPSWRSAWLDLAAAARSCSRSRVPTFGISRSIMYFFIRSFSLRFLSQIFFDTAFFDTTKVNVEALCGKMADMPFYIGQLAHHENIAFFRKLFQRHTGVSPSAYQKRFGARTARARFEGANT